MLYRESIDLWFNSDQFSTIVTTCENFSIDFRWKLSDKNLVAVYAFFLFVSFVVNVLNIIVSYRLFKILETVKYSTKKFTFSKTAIKFYFSRTKFKTWPTGSTHNDCIFSCSQSTLSLKFSTEISTTNPLPVSQFSFLMFTVISASCQSARIIVNVRAY